MPVPEATVHEDHRTVLAQDDIGMAGQTGIVQLVAEATAEQELPYLHLGFRILASDSRHTTLTLFRGQFVHYELLNHFQSNTGQM